MKIKKISNNTRMVADEAGYIYTEKQLKETTNISIYEYLRNISVVYKIIFSIFILDLIIITILIFKYQKTPIN